VKRLAPVNNDEHATAGLSGVNRFWVDQITNRQLDFDVLLKIAFFRAKLYGAAGRLDEAIDYLETSGACSPNSTSDGHQISANLNRSLRTRMLGLAHIVMKGVQHVSDR
jgi:hypothetical protein